MPPRRKLDATTGTSPQRVSARSRVGRSRFPAPTAASRVETSNMPPQHITTAGGATRQIRHLESTDVTSSAAPRPPTSGEAVAMNTSAPLAATTLSPRPATASRFSIGDSGVIAVLVGIQRKRYNWHTNLIRKESPLIAAPLDIKEESCAEETPQLTINDAKALTELEFSSDDPKHFDVITEWLHCRRLDTLAEVGLLSLTLNTYMTACSLDIEALQNDLMDLFQARVLGQTELGLGAWLDHLRELNTYHPKSGMCQYLLDCAAIWMRVRPTAFLALNISDPGRLDDLFAYQPNLAKELVLRSWRQHDPTIDTLIVPFHCHKNGSICNREGCKARNG